MNVAVVEPAEGMNEVAPTAPASEWIDPEGDDWLASIYRFLTEETPRVEIAGRVAASPEVEHWFG
jgi:hypothetical protein